MRRLSLSTKLFAAALPLVLAVGALLALTVRNDLNTLNEAERGAELGRVWTPLVAALTSVESELADVQTTNGGSITQAQLDQITAHRRATDQAMNSLNEAVSPLGAAEAARKHITQGRSALSGSRRSIDLTAMAPEMAAEVDPIDSYEVALRELVSIGQLLPAEAGDSQLGRELLAVVKLAEGRAAADVVIANVAKWEQSPLNPAPLVAAKSRFIDMESALNEFAAVAPEEWSKQYRQSGLSMELATYRAQLDSAQRAAERGEVGTFDLEGFSTMSDNSLELQQDITGSIVDRADTKAAEIRQSTFIRSIIALGAVLLASLIAWLLTRSVTRRVRNISRAANQVASEQLPALVEAIRDPRGKTVLPEIEPVNAKGSDELAELAAAFNSMQGTLVEVAHEQVEVLRRGVSDIFVTMARRNRSLIDRQLAMLDEFEAEVDDPDVLSNYYQLDHMATRMRRNSESLLVLANAEPKRRRVKATEIDDVVRAAIGEVEDYRRIEVETLESLQVRGNVVADVSHLVAELLDNATSFSPPDSAVRVGGRRAGDSYMLRIVDNGVGIGPDRLKELNELLREPPIVGLSVEPTLGMSVVSLLANRHGIAVTLSQGSPGTTVDVLLPSSLFGPIDVPTPGAEPAAASVSGPADEPGIVAWDTSTTSDIDAQIEQLERELEQTPDVSPPVVPAPAWSAMTVDLASLRDTPSDAEPEADSVFAEPATPLAEPAEPDTTVESGAHADAKSDDDQHVEQRAGDDQGFIGDEGVPGEPLIAGALHSSLPTRGPALDNSPTTTVTDDTVTAPEPSAPVLPPPAAVPVASGEFDRPLTPPFTPDNVNNRPVAPSPTPAPAMGRSVQVADHEVLESAPDALLPTRSPSRGPDGGPDRLAAVTPDSSVAPTSSPSALQAALSAFDTRRNGNGDGLPTRARSTDGTVPASFDEPPSITQSRLDPDALRERLRAFQNEFRTASDGAHTTDTSTNADLGGDRR